jgi:hypothetical protein
LNPLLRIEDKLPGIRVGRRENKTAVVAYADDVNIFVTTPEDIPIIRDAIRCYETASGAHLNIRKSKAIATGTWDTTINIMNIPYYTDIKILGFSTASTVTQSVYNRWIKSQAEYEPRRAKHTAEIHAYPKKSCTHMPSSWRKSGTRHKSSRPPTHVCDS